MTTISRYGSIAAVVLILIVSGCGGGGSATTPVSESTNDAVDTQPPVAATGTLGLLLTDKPTDQLSAINVDVTAATLIGGSGQQKVFDGNVRVNLLDLAYFSQPLAFGKAKAGTYSKLRLQLSNLELIDTDGNTFYPPLPANGKIDLLDSSGITISPGRTLLADIDFDANKSIKVQGNGKKGYRMRPVVKVNFIDGGLPGKLARLEGTVSEILDPALGRFLLCSIDNTDACIVVNLKEDSCVLDANGLEISFDDLVVDDQVTVIGQYRHDSDDDGDSDSNADSDSDSDSDLDSDGDSDGASDSDADSDSDSDSDLDNESEPSSDTDPATNDSSGTGGSDGANQDSSVELDAVVISQTLTSQVRGTVNGSLVDDGSFIVLSREGIELRVEIQADCTRILDAEGNVLTADTLQLGVGVDIDGVIIESTADGELATLRAALIFVDTDDELEQLSGTINEPIDFPTFVLAAATGDICIAVLDDAQITLLAADGATMTEGSFDDIAAGLEAEVYGSLGPDGCFAGSELIIQLPAETDP
ncbi:MAG: DUF4382 domain-containing protein [Woeseia sp.]|nr:DUF4382 domain-containing protein [Woeseia sp.]NNL54626.1 DUF4382 domain-containing protein [Woeseia sp.]